MSPSRAPRQSPEGNQLEYQLLRLPHTLLDRHSAPFTFRIPQQERACQLHRAQQQCEQQNNGADNTESNRSHVFHHSQRLGLLGTTGAGQLDHLLRTRPIFVDSRSFAHRIRQADHLLQRNRVKIIARCRINRQPADTVKEA